MQWLLQKQCYRIRPWLASSRLFYYCFSFLHIGHLCPAFLRWCLCIPGDTGSECKLDWWEYLIIRWRICNILIGFLVLILPCYLCVNQIFLESRIWIFLLYGPLELPALYAYVYAPSGGNWYLPVYLFKKKKISSSSSIRAILVQRRIPFFNSISHSDA